ncbi:MAG: sodium ion-translocating decarboxylase subunit beta [Verrucomicrobiia bacterium]
MEVLTQFLQLTGFGLITWQMVTMWFVIGVLLYLAIAKGFEPLLLVPIAFGALLANLPTKGVVNEPAGPILSPADGQVVEWHVRLGDELREGSLVATIETEATVETPAKRYEVRSLAHGEVIALPVSEQGDVREGEVIAQLFSKEPGGLFYYIKQGITLEIFPPIIFLGVGALTDFGPLIANPRTLLLGAAAQIGVMITFLAAFLVGFSPGESASIAIIGGADGPTAIFLSSKLAADLLPAVAVAAYSYMSLVPLIQPPIMRLLTTKKERMIRMRSLRPVSKLERILFALSVTLFCILLVPPAASLVGMLMLGNLLRESGVVDRLVKSAQNEIINITTIFLGTSVGITMTGERFLQPETLKIIGLGVIAFALSTASGVLMAKLMNLFCRNKLNPLIGSAGVSAVPMAARVSHLEGQRADPANFLLMHAMGPNVAGVIGTAVVAGFYISTLA